MSSAGFTPRNTETMRMTDMRAFRQAAALRASGAALVTVVTAEAGDGPRGFHALSATHLSADPTPMTVSVDGSRPAPATILDAEQGTTPATGAPAAASGAVDRAVEEVSRRASAAMVIGRVADVAAADPVPLVACRGTYL